MLSLRTSVKPQELLLRCIERFRLKLQPVSWQWNNPERNYHRATLVISWTFLVCAQTDFRTHDGRTYYFAAVSFCLSTNRQSTGKEAYPCISPRAYSSSC
jgi:hypothetical protein